VVDQPVREELVFQLMVEDNSLDYLPELGNLLFVLFVKFDSKVGLLLLVVEIESHPVEVQTFSRGQVDIVFLLFKGPSDGLRALESFVADFDQEANHFPYLVVDEALSDESKADKGEGLFLAHPVAFWFLLFSEDSSDGLCLNQLGLHVGNKAITARVIGLIALGEIVKAVSAEVELCQLTNLVK